MGTINKEMEMIAEKAKLHSKALPAEVRKEKQQ